MKGSSAAEEDWDYWNYDKPHLRHHACRIKHGQPSWYFSFMGSRKVFDEWRFARDEEND